MKFVQILTRFCTIYFISNHIRIDWYVYPICITWSDESFMKNHKNLWMVINTIIYHWKCLMSRSARSDFRHFSGLVNSYRWWNSWLPTCKTQNTVQIEWWVYVVCERTVVQDRGNVHGPYGCWYEAMGYWRSWNR